MAKAEYGEAPWIDPAAEVTACRLEPWTAVHARSRLLECTLGAYTYIMSDCELTYTTTGRFCSIAAQARINPGNHPLGRAALHHFTYRAGAYGFAPADETAFFDWRRADAVTLGHDVWIGHGVVVLPGVRIGTGAAIGAGAIVTKDVEPFAVMAGNPARCLRLRVPPAVAAGLLRIAWWDWSRERLAAAVEDFRVLDAAAFVEKHDPERR